MPVNFWMLLHLVGVIVWVGGMFFAHACLRPAANAVLQPPSRLPLWAAVFRRFLGFTAVAVVAILVSGLVMMLQLGFKFAPLGWHVMMTLGLVMACIFVYVYAVLFPAFCRLCEAAAWPAAAATLNAIRRMVATNLVLSVLTLLAAVYRPGA